jgi:hypothetical protein
VRNYYFFKKNLELDTPWATGLVLFDCHAIFCDLFVPRFDDHCATQMHGTCLLVEYEFFLVWEAVIVPSCSLEP